MRLFILLAALVLFAVWVFWVVLIANGGEDNDGYIDFFSYWAGSSLALHGEGAAAFDPERMKTEQAGLPGASEVTWAWRYPPTFFFFVIPFAVIPVALALAGWVAVYGALMFSALRRISSAWALVPLAFIFPGTYSNMLIGQNGLLTAGLFAWGMLLLRDRPAIAGVLLGLMTYKPQFFPLVLVALLATRQRTAVATAVATAVLLAFASLLLFGIDSWRAFYDSSVATGDDLYSETSSIKFEWMQSVSSLLLGNGVPPEVARVVQGVVALAGAVFVFWLWRSDADFEYKAAGLGLAILIAAPYSYHYDFTLMGFAMLWLGVRIAREGWRPEEAGIFAVAFVTPYAPTILGGPLGFPIGPLVLLALLWVLVRRMRRDVREVLRMPEPSPIAVMP